MGTYNITDMAEIIRGLSRRVRLLELQGNGTVVKTGLAADRPSAPDVGSGTTTTYYAYNTKVLSVWNTDTSDWDEVTLS